MEGLYLKIHDAYGKTDKIRISCFNLMEESTESKRMRLSANQWHTVPDSPSLSFEGSAFRYLKCFHCGHNDFNDDSWDINLYECNGCGKPIGINQWEETKK